jgi:nucleoside-diphosphate-sugar epimerase
MKRAIVTGSSGLLGRHVAAALGHAGWAVTGVDLAPPPPGAQWTHVAADAADPDALAGIFSGADVVAHCAAIPRPTGFTARDVFMTNVATTFSVVEAAEEARVGRLIYASSFSVHGWPFFVRPFAPAFLPVDEAHPVAPQDPYGLSKLVGEEIVEAAVRRGAFTAVSLRMPWIQTSESFWREVGPRRESTRSADDLWAYIDAEDAADAFAAAAGAPVGGYLCALLSAPDTYMDAPTEALIRDAFPSTPLRADLPGDAATLDATVAYERLGFAPRRSWRGYRRFHSVSTLC